MSKAATTHKDMSQKLDYLDRLILPASLAIAICFLYQVLKYCHYGIDFTDEGFYLNWISNPWIYPASTTQFGFIYHPLFRLVGEDIALLRQMNILITLGLTWILSANLLNQLASSNNEKVELSNLYTWAVAFLLSISSLTYLKTWLLTPSYNTLALQALLITATGLLNSKRESSFSSISGWILIGVGGWLAFMAKPTTAAALGIMITVALVFSHRMNLKLLFLSAGTAIALLLLSALIIDSSLSAFFYRIEQGADKAAIMGGGHTLTRMLRWDIIILGFRERLFFVVLTGLLFLLFCLSHSTKVFSGWIRAFLQLIILILCIWIMNATESVASINFKFLGLAPGIILISSALASLVAANIHIVERMDRRRLVSALLFLIFPYIYVFGTGNHYWIAVSGSAVFWVFSGVSLIGMFFKDSIRKSLTSVSVATLLITVVLVHTGLEYPYRQPSPLRDNNNEVSFSGHPGKLTLSIDSAEYLHQLNRLASNQGFTPGTPILDLTGRSPTAVYAMGAKAIGQAWMIGGYSGSDLLATETLKLFPCSEIAASWVLTEINGPRVLNTTILSQFGIEISRDYQLAGSVNSPKAGFKVSFKQQLWKPIRTLDKGIAACQKHKAAQ